MNWLRLIHSHRARNPRILVVPDQWSGSVQEFYHFFLFGYLTTLIPWFGKVTWSALSVRDCGTMGPWFRFLPWSPDLEMLTPGGTFNKTTAAEVPASGRDVRSTPNLSHLAAAMSEPTKDRPWGVVDAMAMPPREQLTLFESLRVLVSQHGTAIADMIRVPSGVGGSNRAPGLRTPFFQSLAQACGHTGIRIDHAHAEVPKPEFHADVNLVFDGDAAQ